MNGNTIMNEVKVTKTWIKRKKQNKTKKKQVKHKVNEYKYRGESESSGLFVENRRRNDWQYPDWLTDRKSDW